jgi:hypothetical protein
MSTSRKEKPSGAGLRRISLVAAMVALQFILAGPAAAGYPDKDQLATGKPERTLSGIEVGVDLGMSIAEVIQLYGPPASKEDAVVPDGIGGTRFYKWEWPGLRMSVATMFFYKHDEKNWEAKPVFVESRADYIDVWGKAPKGVLGITGRGLALGSTLSDLKALYGEHYSIPYTEKDGSSHALVQWADGTELTVDYGPDGRCNHIRVAGGMR